MRQTYRRYASSRLQFLLLATSARRAAPDPESDLFLGPCRTSLRNPGLHGQHREPPRRMILLPQTVLRKLRVPVSASTPAGQKTPPSTAVPSKLLRFSSPAQS